MYGILEDVWESDSETDIRTAEGSLSSPDLRKLQEGHFKRGYVDGLSQSTELKLQEGFDRTFPLGSRIGMEVGRLIGILQCLDFIHGTLDEELHADFELAKNELKIAKILTKSMFDVDLNLNGEHPLISKWKHIVKVHCNKYAPTIDDR